MRWDKTPEPYLPHPKPFGDPSELRDPLPHELPRLLRDTPLLSHVRDAINKAVLLADGWALNARSALHGALLVGRENSGLESFNHLNTLLSIDIPPLPSDVAREPDWEVGVALAEPLADSLDLLYRRLPADGEIWGRDWITVLLLTRGDPSLDAIAAEAGHSVAALRYFWFTHVTSSNLHRSLAEWEDWWRDAGVPLPTDRPVRSGYRPESVRHEDQLGVTRDARSFARLIADTHTMPPLSIGLLGDWGSGKSFFLELLHQEVEALTRSRFSSLCRNVVQIRFNAWHYSDTNLWASLVGHIFDEIWTQIVPQATPAEVRRALEKQIEDAHGALFEADAQLDEAHALLMAAEEQRRQELHNLALGRLVSENTRKILGEAARAVGWNEPLHAVVQVEDSLRELAASGGRLRLLLETALQRYPAGQVFLWIAGSVIAATGISLLAVNQGAVLIQEAIPRLATVGAVVASLVSAVAVPLRHAGRLVSRFIGALQVTVNEYEDEVRKLAQDPQQSGHAEQIERARSELSRAEFRVAAARERIADLETRRSSLDPGRRLAAFLESRAQSDDYRSRQGILSLVRSDFEQLSKLMADWREERSAPPSGIRPLDRIVLYIDDLDRCSPAVVVQALEAIHLLLALELFVVVVAVDSRWLLRSLEVHYSSLLAASSGDGNEYRLSTPQSYLEKIFQITFALAPMDETGFSRFIDHLVSPVVPNTLEPLDTLAEGPELNVGNADAQNEEGTDDDDARAAPGPAAPQEASATSTADSPGEACALDPEVVDPSRPLVISDAEREFLKSLHPLVPTPRVAKRIVNVFRIIKAGVPPHDLAEFESASDGRHRVVLLLLTLLYGRPRLAGDLLQRLTPGNSSQDAATPLHQETSFRQADGWSEVRPLIAAVAPELTIGDCRNEVATVSRYSFALSGIF